MSEIGRVRVRVPSSIRTGDVVRVRAQIIHPMERNERDAQGRILPKPYNYLTRVTATYLGRPIVTFETTQSVSENPVFSFTFRAVAAGPLTLTFLDTRGGRWEGTADIRPS